MSKNFLRKAISLLNGESSTANQAGKAEAATEVPRFLLTRYKMPTADDLTTAIVEALQSYGYAHEVCRAIQLFSSGYTYNAALESILNDVYYQERLRRTLAGTALPLGTAWYGVFLKEPPPEGAMRIGDGLFMDIAYAGVRITALNGKLSQPEYILSGRAGRHIYNIGRSQYPRLSNGAHHENHIVIDEHPQDEQHVIANQHVSRAHALIINSMNSYSLKALPGGSAVEEGRTRIYRKGQFIDVNNLDLGEPLEDNDQIELSKNVVLKFQFMRP